MYIHTMEKQEMKLENYNDTLIFFREAFSEFIDEMSDYGVVLGDEHEKSIDVQCSNEVLTNIVEWINNGHIKTPPDFTPNFNTMINGSGIEISFILPKHTYLFIDLSLEKKKSKVKLPLEVFNDEPVDADKAWAELDRLCRGH